MIFDFKNIQAKKKTPKPIDPIELFQAASVTDKNINDLWLAQGDALREWHKSRGCEDIGVVLNTGAGKTLVGLLIAQSLVNESGRQVVYACSSIQLVEQTAKKALGYGLPATTYYRQNFSSDEYHRAEAPCITTYQALFNGRSRFVSDDICAVIFDDAHAAEHLLRDHFSLRIDRARLESTYFELMALFRAYHVATGKTASYEELISGNSQSILLIPPFEVYRNSAELTRVLLSAGLDEVKETLFAWEYIRDHQDLCCVLVSKSEITFTPLTVPVSILPYFQKGVRRVYLSATLSAPDAFARTFGRVPQRLVAPSTTAGECERLILMPSISKLDEDDISSTSTALENRKALILVPTYARSEKWSAIASPPPRDAVTEYVDSFRDADPASSEKLILAARYDGVDFPGDTCRIMVIDDLPMGSGPLERFLWESINLLNSLRSTLASRIVQSFGRISRGMSDHGVVFLTGKRLIEWIVVPRNMCALPAFLQKQLQLGYQVSESLDSPNNLNGVVEACLSRNLDWISSYSNFLKAADAGGEDADSGVLSAIALSEAAYSESLWNRDYSSAAITLSKTLDVAFKISGNTGAWHSLWLGYALERAGNLGAANEHYRRAHAVQKNIPSIVMNNLKSEPTTFPNQVLEVEQQMNFTSESTVKLPKTLNRDLVALNGSGSVAQIEEALRCLGQYLGFTSSRPEKETGTGPDVLWQIEGGHALCMEAKTGKTGSNQYTKENVGQLSDHVQWVKNNTEATDIVPVFIGPIFPASKSANPAPEVVVIELSQFDILGHRLVSTLNDAVTDALPLTLRSILLQLFSERDLLWPAIYDGIKKSVLREIL